MYIWPRGYKNKVHKLAASGHVSASSQSLRFILSLRLYSSFITSRPDFNREMIKSAVGYTFRVQKNCFMLYQRITKYCYDKYYYLKPSSKIYVLLTAQRPCLFCGSFLLFMFRVCHAFLRVQCSLVVNCWERANLVALLCVVFCGVLHFPVWCPHCPGLAVVLYCIDS